MNDNPTITTAGVRLPEADVIVLALHGRQQGPSYLLDNLVSLIEGDMSTAWVLPSANGGSWYPDRADVDSRTNHEAVAASIARLDIILAEIRSVTNAPIVLLGFSQGACLACQFAARRPNTFDALIALTGGLIGPRPEEFDVAPFTREVSAYFAAGDSDPWIHAGRVRATAQAFVSAGATVTLRIFQNDGHHHIRPIEVKAVATVIGELTSSTG